MVYSDEVLEVGGSQARPLLEDQHREAGLRQLPRHHAAGGAGSHHHEIDHLTGFECLAAQVVPAS
jgi:hypothetical protein